MERTVCHMVNPSAMQQLGKEHGREILQTSGAPRPRAVKGSRVRERLGWSLIGLGVRLALDGQPGRVRSYVGP
jgi:hypothetical protein